MCNSVCRCFIYDYLFGYVNLRRLPTQTFYDETIEIFIQLQDVIPVMAIVFIHMDSIYSLSLTYSYLI